MSEYVAPLKDMQFVLNELAGLDQVAKLPGCEDVSAELVEQILEESGKFCGEVLSPLNHTGDAEGAKWDQGRVTTPKGFIAAYKQFVEGGWNALQFPPEFGGQGLPKLVATPVMEMWKSANLSFSLCPLLTGGAIEALLLRGADGLKRTFLPKMVEGSWTGTMNLTEPQAGSDLALVKSKAVPEGDHYRVYGQKIFITYGEHDLAENIVHLVLARTPDAPEGVKGISLFIAPKFLVNADGSLGKRNDVQCASIEYKFIMMNAARFAVGLEGVAVSERAYQLALGYAKERVQGRDLAGGAKAVPIIRQPDVRRMLMSMKAQTEAMRALAYVVAAAMDIAHRDPDSGLRAKHQAFADMMIPVVKGWSTENCIEVASIGIQVHGGMGYVEETGAAQLLRDARITTIYEGTTAIQSNDLVGRKMAREGGATAKEVIKAMRVVEGELGQAQGEDMAAIRAGLAAGIKAVEECVSWIVATYATDIKAVHAGSVPFLKMMGIVCGGWQMARAALVAQQRLASKDGDAAFYQAKIATARFYADHILAQAPGLRNTVVRGAAGVMALTEEQF